jgi:hypothetical protein
MKTILLIGTATLICQITSAQEIYSGQFRDGIPHGFGILDYNDGSYYQGMFKNGFPNGPGTFCDAKGEKTTGVYEQGEFGYDYQVVENSKLFDLVSEIDSSSNLNSMSIDIEFLKKPKNRSQYIIAPLGEFTINGVQVSAGIMNKTEGFRTRKHEGKKISPSEIDYAFYLKRYDERTPKSMFRSKTGFCKSGGNDGTNNGEFVSVLHEFELHKGIYTLYLSRVPKSFKIKGVVHSYLRMDIYDHKNEEGFFIGAVAIPGTTFHLGNQLNTFVSTHTSACDIVDLPSSEFKIGNLFVNEQPQSFFDSYCQYSYSIPQFSKAEFIEDYMSVTCNIGEAYKSASVIFEENGFKSFLIYHPIFESNE